jgi:hypothetical protein
VSINGVSSKHFFIYGGVWQGYAIVLFILVGEALNHIIKQKMHIGIIKGVTFPSKNKQQIFKQYVDDATLTIKVEQKYVEKIIEILNIFQDIFNLEINWFKSCVFW